MAEPIDDLYMKIAQGIISAIDTPWEKAVIQAEILEDAANFNGEYFNEGKTLYFEVEDDVYDYFEEIKEIMTERNKWNRAIFILKPSGDFKIYFEWDQDLDDEIGGHL